jgi:hypothetical protein
MDTSTLRAAADTVTERVADLAHTVGDVAPDVTQKIGDTALRLAALTPWVEEATATRRSRRWLVAIALVVVGAGLATWWAMRRAHTADEAASTAATPTTRAASSQGDRRLASAGR